MWNQLVADPDLPEDQRQQIGARLDELRTDQRTYFEQKAQKQPLVRDLIDYDDGFLVWNPLKEMVYHVALRNQNLVNCVQTFLPTRPPMFDVFQLRLNANRRYMLLAGRKSLTVIEMPRKYSSHLVYEGGKPEISVKSWSLIERFFICNDKIALLDSKWHPGSVGHTHVILLTNDNCIRIVDIAEPAVALQEIKLPIDGDMDEFSSCSVFARSLGEGAVSFDFGLPISRTKQLLVDSKKDKNIIRQPKNSSLQVTTDLNSSSFLGISQKNNETSIHHKASSGANVPSALSNTNAQEAGDENEQKQQIEVDLEDIFWPVFVLKGNGDVLLVYNSLYNHYVSKRVFGPLRMLLFSEDSYGADACSLIVLNSNPAVLVIGTSNGILYHCIAIDQNDDDSYIDYLPQYDLYVYESIELTLSLNSSMDLDNACQMRLIKQDNQTNRYFCLHLAGLHVINVFFTDQLRSSALSNEQCSETLVEHLICTKPITSSQVSGQQDIYPIGVTLAVQKKFLMMVLVSNGDLFSQRLSMIFLSRKNTSTKCPVKASTEDADHTASAHSREQLKPVEFNERIQQLLQRKTNTPLIKSNTNCLDTNGKECFQFLLNSTQMLRNEYLAKFDSANELISRRVASLAKERQVQLDDISTLYTQKAKLDNQTEQLQTKYQQTLQRQENISARIDRLIDQLHKSQMHISDAELRMMKDLQQIKEKISVYEDKLKQIEQKFQYQEEISGHLQSATTKQQMCLISPRTNNTDQMEKQLRQHSEEIAVLLQYINYLKQKSNLNP